MVNDYDIWDAVHVFAKCQCDAAT